MPVDILRLPTGTGTLSRRASSRVDLFGYGESVIDLDPEVARRALYLLMPQRVGFILRISFLIENQRPAAHRSVLAVATGCAGR